MPQKTSDPTVDLLTWIIKALVILYSIVILGSLIAFILLEVRASIEILGSITGLLTTAIGGLLTAVFRNRRRN